MYGEMLLHYFYMLVLKPRLFLFRFSQRKKIETVWKVYILVLSSRAESSMRNAK
jgi:hypothetical protein